MTKEKQLKKLKKSNKFQPLLNSQIILIFSRFLLVLHKVEP